MPSCMYQIKRICYNRNSGVFGDWDTFVTVYIGIETTNLPLVFCFRWTIIPWNLRDCNLQYRVLWRNIGHSYMMLYKPTISFVIPISLFRPFRRLRLILFKGLPLLTSCNTVVLQAYVICLLTLLSGTRSIVITAAPYHMIQHEKTDLSVSDHTNLHKFYLFLL